MAQAVERILGKDEVPSSNLGISSIEKALIFKAFSLFQEKSNPAPKSHLATIWLLERDFFVFMPLLRGGFPVRQTPFDHPLAGHARICSW